MPLSIVMPALEVTQENEHACFPLKKEGETVVKGEPVLVETDKAVLELDLPLDGILTRRQSARKQRRPGRRHNCVAGSTQRRLPQGSSSPDFAQSSPSCLATGTGYRASARLRPRWRNSRGGRTGGGRTNRRPSASALLAVGGIADRVVPANRQPAVRRMMTLDAIVRPSTSSKRRIHREDRPTLLSCEALVKFLCRTFD
jgi:hypothetical protein